MPPRVSHGFFPPGPRQNQNIPPKRSHSPPPFEETPLVSNSTGTAELLAEAQEHPELDPEAVVHLRAVKQHDTVYDRSRRHYVVYDCPDIDRVPMMRLRLPRWGAWRDLACAQRRRVRRDNLGLAIRKEGLEKTR